MEYITLKKHLDEDAINSFIEKYNDELESLDEDMAAVPQCVKLERYTVLNNLITLLTHLKGLKK